MNASFVRPTLLVPVKDRERFLDMYFEKGGLGGLFIAGGFDLELGEEVDLEVQFLDEHTSFRIRGCVRWRRSQSGRRSLPPGMGIEFDPADAGVQEMLLDYAMGHQVTMVPREDRRLPAHLPVKAEGDKFETDDISEGGAFILTDRALPEGTEVKLNFRPPGRLFGFSVDGVVAWRRDGERAGVGVEFRFRSPRGREQMQRMIRQLRQEIIREVRVRVPQLK